ncbi:MAG: helix-turn-helix transcriptional regulator [Cytophagales bacterium]|nr:helix-turn-helix transcriptional regulator [Cytophagales bacterium]MCA6387568.1 helix-turn-helix transcriptional regulator [Cytophagales bacterium]MCA6390313.1 helix-turn-helix transcriptional regulator [Cytophagales bacterium]MCA6399353.1 helix-turn-helix transcriptional regulator [Cytophagales bacterium]MCA6400631.1 helix-turn-helix transcriptional regulator [Cytophagales bacterium]
MDKIANFISALLDKISNLWIIMTVNYGSRIKEELIRRGISVDDIAKNIGVSREVFYKIQQGKKKNLGLDECIKIWDALGVTPNEFLGYKNNSPKHLADNRIERIAFAMYDLPEHQKELVFMDVLRTIQIIKASTR